MEEILIKDEPGSWFEENEGSCDNVPYSEQEAAYEYDHQTVEYPSNVQWAVSSASQPHPVEGHLPQGMPRTSGLQGVSVSISVVGK